MRRILAIICIIILLLFTGMPMFTSNLFCNQINVYADNVPETIDSDREKVIAALTVYLNDHKGVLRVIQGFDNVPAEKYAVVLTDMFMMPFISYYRFEQHTIESLADIASYIDVTNDPFIVRLYSPAVSFFNAFLQWMIDNGKITNNPTGSDGLYDGEMYGDSLFYVFNGNISNLGNNFIAGEFNESQVQRGTARDGMTASYFRSLFPNIDFSSSDNIGNISKNITCQFTGDYTYSTSIEASTMGWRGDYNPAIVGLTMYANPYVPYGVLYCERLKKVFGCMALARIKPTNNPSYVIACYVNQDLSTGKYYCVQIHKYNSTPEGTQNANIGLNKDGFDFNPTAEPGSDGLTYQPKQNGTGNTYNNYNYYYNDYHEGDTYIYHPGSGGGSGGEDPTPGGTTPPWDGTQNPGTPAGTLTPGSDGYYFNLPDIGLPDLNIDWSINGLKEKFPFSIPWDLMAFFAVMNAEPETPYIKADIPLGLWEWNIDWDLHAFDNVARILRNMELIGFCIGLILITRSIIKG